MPGYGVGLLVGGVGDADGKGNAVGDPVGWGVPVGDAEPAGVVCDLAGVVREPGLGVVAVARGDAVRRGVGEDDGCTVAGVLSVAGDTGLTHTQVARVIRKTAVSIQVEVRTRRTRGIS